MNKTATKNLCFGDTSINIGQLKPINLNISTFKNIEKFVIKKHPDQIKQLINNHNKYALEWEKIELT